MSDYRIEYRRAPDPVAEARDRALREVAARKQGAQKRAWVTAWVEAGIDPLEVGDASRASSNSNHITHYVARRDFEAGRTRVAARQFFCGKKSWWDVDKPAFSVGHEIEMRDGRSNAPSAWLA